MAVVAWLAAGCGLDALTRGNGVASGAEAGQSSVGQAGTPAEGGTASVDVCDGYDFCATFDTDGAPSPSEFSTIRDKPNTTIVQAGGSLEADVAASADCNYADVGVAFDETHRGYRIEFLVRRETDVSAFIMTASHRALDESRRCLDLLGSGTAGVPFQTNANETTIDQTELQLPVGRWARVSMTSMPLAGGGTRHELSIDGRVAVIERPMCELGSHLEVSLGFYCYGGTGRASFDNFRVALIK